MGFNADAENCSDLSQKLKRETATTVLFYRGRSTKWEELIQTDWEDRFNVLVYNRGVRQHAANPVVPVDTSFRHVFVFLDELKSWCRKR